MAGVEDKKCSVEIHAVRAGEDIYVYNGKPFGCKSVFCVDLECFLKNLDESSIVQYMESLPKRKSRK